MAVPLQLGRWAGDALTLKISGGRDLIGIADSLGTRLRIWMLDALG